MKEKKLSNNIMNDYLANNQYVKLTRDEEMHYIKKAKLSFYENATDEEQKKYIKYYDEEFPGFIESLKQAGDKKEKVLRKAISESEKYCEFFIMNNQRLIIKWLKRKILSTQSLTLIDLVQEANIGMIKALERFDIEKGYKFSTYAMWWIRENISRSIGEYDKMIRLPVRFREDLKKVNIIINELENTSSDKPTIADIAKLSGISEKRIKKILEYKKTKEFPVSLETPTNEDEDSFLGDFVESDEQDLDEFVERKQISSLIKQIVENCNLDYRSKKILFLRYGLINDKVYTYDEIAMRYNISSERIRQIEKNALKKLCLNPKLKAIYYNELPIVDSKPKIKSL